MSKRERHFQKIAETKERLRQVSTDKLVERYNTGYLTKKGAIAIREVLEERGEAYRIRS